MESIQPYEFVILGGGLAGLTFALEAAGRGSRVAVLERGPEAGGLARTMAYGDYRFDLGGHRFHSRWPHINDWVHDLMDGDLLEVARRSRILLDRQYVDYPLQLPNVLGALSLPKAAQVLTSYLKASWRRDDHHTDASFESWVVSRFGRTLYEIYFQPYTEKVWGMDCTHLSADWASQRIKLPNLAAAVRGSLLRFTAPPSTLVSRFLYPPQGIGMIPTRIAERALATGRAAIHLNSQAFQAELGDFDNTWRVHFRQDGRRQVITGRQLVSTIPLGALMRILPSTGTPPSSLNRLTYRSLICVFLALDGPRISADTWTYFPDRHLTVGRTHEPPNWSPQMAPSGRTSLCAEVFCTEGDELWHYSDQRMIAAVLDDLESVNFLARDRVRDAWLLRVPDAYPVYGIGYADALGRLRYYLARWPTLHLTGRTGSFQYLNMDKVIDQALGLVKELVPAG
jgi:protoporphyrinogen oxidase